MAESERFIHLQALEFIPWESVDGHAISKFRHLMNGLVGITGGDSKRKSLECKKSLEFFRFPAPNRNCYILH